MPGFLTGEASSFQIRYWWKHTLLPPPSQPPAWGSEPCSGLRLWNLPHPQKDVKRDSHMCHMGPDFLSSESPPWWLSLLPGPESSSCHCHVHGMCLFTTSINILVNFTIHYSVLLGLHPRLSAFHREVFRMSFLMEFLGIECLWWKRENQLHACFPENQMLEGAHFPSHVLQIFPLSASPWPGSFFKYLSCPFAFNFSDVCYDSLCVWMHSVYMWTTAQCGTCGGQRAALCSQFPSFWMWTLRIKLRSSC